MDESSHRAESVPDMALNFSTDEFRDLSSIDDRIFHVLKELEIYALQDHLTYVFSLQQLAKSSLCHTRLA